MLYEFKSMYIYIQTLVLGRLAVTKKQTLTAHFIGAQNTGGLK